ncbi:molecular chaperone DnaJ [candidate division KSB1 bacterium]|nr:molecular chaperone DnaJ [candidate division KSB1 bacterium]
MAKDYYQILGVNEQASNAEIKKVYRELAKKFHPDANKNDKNAESRFKEISEAYTVLSNAEKRKQYDQMRRLGAFGPGAGNFAGGGFNFDDLRNNWSTQNGQRQGTRGFSIEDLFGAGSFGLGDILEGLFDRGGRARRERWGGKQQGESLRSAITIPFEVAINGGKQIIQIEKDDKCSACKGVGAKSGTKPEVCTSCNGTGTISISQGFFAVNRPCPRCYGRGHIIVDPCPVCQGSGEVHGVKKLAVNITPGMSDGTELRLKGQGQPGINGGPPGDIYLTIHMAPHHFFQRKGDDIYCTVPIDIIKAIIGTKIRVKTVTGKKVELKIPPNSRDGKIFKLKGFGVIGLDKKGDFYVTIMTVERSNYSEEEKKIMEEFEHNGKSTNK